MVIVGRHPDFMNIKIPALTSWSSYLARELHTRQIWRALLVSLPVLVAFWWSGDRLWLQSAVIALATLIGLERVGLAPLGVLLHGVLTLLCFMALLFSLHIPALFIVVCASMAAATVGLMAYGRKLRSLGNFIFIPALYLACEIAQNCPPDRLVSRALQVLPYLALCIVPVLLLSLLDVWRAPRSSSASLWSTRFHLRHAQDLGAMVPVGAAVTVVLLAVSSAAVIALFLHLEHLQWLIWSTASVVTGDRASAQLKLFDRARGALLGVPLGVMLGWLLPHGAQPYGLVVMASLLTLVAFKRYCVGFGARCACVACALMLANQGALVAAERVFDVLLGGAVGVLFVLAQHYVARQR